MSQNSFWSAGKNATLRGVGIKVFWAYPTIVVQDTAELIVLYMPAGVLGKDTDHKPTPRELLSAEKINIADCQWERTDVLSLLCQMKHLALMLCGKLAQKILTVGMSIYKNLLSEHP